MKEYIEYEAVIETLRKLYNEPEEQHKEKNYYVGICAVAGELALIPDADVAPVVHGEWDEEHYVGTKHHACWRCSKCKSRQILKYKYCPNCGAKMDGGNTNDNIR